MYGIHWPEAGPCWPALWNIVWCCPADWNWTPRWSTSTRPCICEETMTKLSRSLGNKIAFYSFIRSRGTSTIWRMSRTAAWQSFCHRTRLQWSSFDSCRNLSVNNGSQFILQILSWWLNGSAFVLRKYINYVNDMLNIARPVYIWTIKCQIHILFRDSHGTVARVLHYILGSQRTVARKLQDILMSITKQSCEIHRTVAW